MKLAMKRTPGELARCYQQVSEKIDQAYALLVEARELYKATYDENFEPVPRSSSYTEYVHESVKKDFKRRCWSRIIELMQIEKIASASRWKKIQDRLYRRDKDDMPAITEAEIITMYQSFVQNARDILEEAVQEVADFLRPGRWGSDGFKTNKPDEIGEKVILEYMLDTYGIWRVDHYRIQGLCNVDRVFHVLDGNIEAYNKANWSPLVDAINQNATGGETEYFAWKGYKNRNLHLTIKRMDLVAEMARILQERILKG